MLVDTLAMASVINASRNFLFPGIVILYFYIGIFYSKMKASDSLVEIFLNLGNFFVSTYKNNTLRTYIN